ncbi:MULTISPECIES: hybrid sensor histidine kinase/response regulator transcription factor [Bacteroides]|jgi:two-component system sensor histidine kinase/response regulator|uniref:hybrid sensor histidine kinase/response regulator transcription factor n=1 Tax=Bacteroides TaxID=816 RepID=UPI0022E99329|nr:hybrid sensor histidine kinase/response regulator transcription factor [Bacteroides xylanisolvens]
MKRTAFILCLLLTAFQTSFAADKIQSKIDIINLNVNSGLASNEVTCIVQDNLGFMWFGTTNGLCRYDGYQFKTYRSDYLSPSFFVSNHILLMEKDVEGNLWIVTTKEFVKFNPVTGRTTPVNIDTYLLNKIKSLLITRKGEILIGTTVGIYKYSKEEDNFVFLKKAYIRSLYEDSRGTIWVGTWGSGFFTFRLDNSQVVEYWTTFLDKPLNVTGFVEDEEHRMWISTWDNGGLLRLNDPFNAHSEDYTLYPSSEHNGHLPSGVLYKLMYDADNDEIWVGTAKGLVVLNDLEKTDGFTVYGADVLGSSEIWTLYGNGGDILWASALGGGVNKMVRRNVSFAYNSLPDKKSGSAVVTSLYEDENETVWMGTRLDVLLLWDRKTGRQYSYKMVGVLKELSKEGNAVQSILKHRITGSLWLGTRYDGVYVLKYKNDKPFSLKRLRDEMPGLKNINALAQDAVGRVWIASEQGLYIGNSIQDEKYNIQPVEKVNEAIKGECVQALLCDSGGTWIGTKSYGAFHLSVDGNLAKYDQAGKKLNYDNVLCFCRDTNDKLWIGTQGGGLSIYNESADQFEMLEVVRSFSDNAVYSIVEDGQQNLWLATGKGLVYMSLSQKDYVILYTQSDGIVNTQFVPGASLLLSNSEILFGGYNGVDCYVPHKSKIDSVPPRTVIVDVSIMNVPLQELIDRGEIDECQQPPYTRALTLMYDQNNVMLNFSSLSYTNPQANRYAYRMKGVDKDWIYVDANKRYISYNNLMKGEYVFEVKSCNENSIWSEPVEMKLTVLPPPWLTWWAYLIYVLLVIAGTSIVVRTIRKRILLQNALKIEQIEHKKSEEVNQAKLKFFTNISHELFTPLSVMQCSIDSLKQEGQADGQTLNIMKMNLKRLQRLLQQIMEFRKAESGNLKLKVSCNNVVVFVRDLCEENFYPLLQAKNITLNFQAEEEVITGYFDVDKLDKILYNLLSNALKYNYQDGIVSVSVAQTVREEKRWLVLKVENTGDGIPENKLPLLFKRFYEGDYRKFKTKGTGIGLSLTKDLVELHQGTISVESIPGETTLFTVMIPADRENYADEQIDEEPERPSDEPTGTDDKAETEVVPEEPTHVLVVEDDVDLLTVMTKVLGKHFKVSTATNGLEALAVLKGSDRIEVVVTDYVMPEMNGIELCREIRKDVALSHLPLVMLTAKTQTEYHLEGYDAGADVYLTKPVEMAVLTAQLKALIANRKRLIQKFRQKEDLNVQELGLSELDREFMDKAISTVEQQMEDSEFSNEVFCQMMNMTQSTLYRKLKSLTGMSPNEFIRDVRIKKACMLLQRPDLQVSDVAYMVGFTDPKYFSLIFKKEKGMSPTKYIESLGC